MEGVGSDGDVLVPPAVDTLPINIAILAEDGTVRWTNRAWQEFGAANDIAMCPETLGVNYLDVTAAADDEHAEKAYQGISAVLSAERGEFELEYLCHSPTGTAGFCCERPPSRPPAVGGQPWLTSTSPSARRANSRATCSAGSSKPPDRSCS